MRLHELLEDDSQEELLARIRKKQKEKRMQSILTVMHDLVQADDDKQSISGYAFEISRYLGGAMSPRELERLYLEKYDNQSTVKEWGRIVQGVNTTVDVKPGETERQARKFFGGDGKPKLLNASAAKNTTPNRMFNLGLEEHYTPLEIAIMEGGHSLEN